MCFRIYSGSSRKWQMALPHSFSFACLTENTLLLLLLGKHRKQSMQHNQTNQTQTLRFILDLRWTGSSFCKEIKSLGESVSPWWADVEYFWFSFNNWWFRGDLLLADRCISDAGRDVKASVGPEWAIQHLLAAETHCRVARLDGFPQNRAVKIFMAFQNCLAGF